MPHRATFSAQTIAVLSALVGQPASWRHGYDLARETGLKSGTLYPILVRLSDRGVVEARWEEGEPSGRPRRHLYRLTSEGLEIASAAAAIRRQPRRQASAGPRPAAQPRPAGAEGS